MDHPVGSDVFQCLNGAGGPADLNRTRFVVGAQAEMHGTGARGRIAEAGGHVIELAAALAGDFDRSADAVAIAPGSLERDIQPVSAALAAVHPDLRRLP